MRNFDFTPLYRSTVGFDQFADLLDRTFASNEGQNTYPPYNIEKTADDVYRISIAVAGFSEDDLAIETRESQLVITANKADPGEKSSFLHRGIAQRAFEKRFQLADHVKATGANVENGMLYVDLVREMPEALKPRQIAIGGAKTIAGKAVKKAVAKAA